MEGGNLGLRNNLGLFASLSNRSQVEDFGS